jgi:hypothetical protein
MGLALPAGNLDAGERMADFFGPQFWGLIDVGGKPSGRVFLGA